LLVDVVGFVRRVALWGVAIVAGLVSQKADIVPDMSREHYRVVVRVRSDGQILHEELWKGEATGAKNALAQIVTDLARLSVSEFCSDYSIRLGG